MLCLQTGQYSTQIFSLAVLLSSLFVYNQMGGIDEAALDRLSLVTEMTKHIRVKAGDGAGKILLILVQWHTACLSSPNVCLLICCMQARLQTATLHAYRGGRRSRAFQLHTQLLVAAARLLPYPGRGGSHGVPPHSKVDAMKSCLSPFSDQ